MKPKPLGAYEKVSPEHRDIQRAVSFALSNKKLASPVKKVSDTKIQMVAGTNYSFVLRLEDGDQYDAVVYESLDKVMSVTDFKPL